MVLFKQNQASGSIITVCARLATACCVVEKLEEVWHPLFDEAGVIGALLRITLDTDCEHGRRETLVKNVVLLEESFSGN